MLCGDSDTTTFPEIESRSIRKGVWDMAVPSIASQTDLCSAAKAVEIAEKVLGDLFK